MDAEFGSSPRFADRRQAGEELAERLRPLGELRPLVLALPRGGVPVALPIARALAAPLHLLLVRKIGAPGFAELGLGAVVDGTPPLCVLNESMVAAVRASPAYLEAERERQQAELERRRARLGVPPLPPVQGATVLLVDDGIATGGTVQAALQALRAAGARRCIVAVPVAPPDAAAGLGLAPADWVCLHSPSGFQAVGSHYADFHQLDDDEVLALLHGRAGG